MTNIFRLSIVTNTHDSYYYSTTYAQHCAIVQWCIFFFRIYFLNIYMFRYYSINYKMLAGERRITINKNYLQEIKSQHLVLQVENVKLLWRIIFSGKCDITITGVTTLGKMFFFVQHTRTSFHYLNVKGVYRFPPLFVANL